MSLPAIPTATPTETPVAAEALMPVEVEAAIDDETAFEDEATVLDQTEPEAPATPEADRRRRVRNTWNLAAITAISFSLTFVGMSIALLAGVLPPSIAAIQPPVDLAVLMLMVPLCALVFTMLADILRTAIVGVPRVRPPRPTPALSNWQPGHGEG